MKNKSSILIGLLIGGCVAGPLVISGSFYWFHPYQLSAPEQAAFTYPATKATSSPCERYIIGGYKCVVNYEASDKPRGTLVSYSFKDKPMSRYYNKLVITYSSREKGSLYLSKGDAFNEAMRKEIWNKGYTYTVEEAKDPEVEKGHLVNATLTGEDKVTLVISSDAVTVPVFKGKTLAEVEKWAENSKYTIEKQVKDSDQPAGLVLDQLIDEKRKVLSLVVAADKKLTIPDVVGKSYKEALTELSSNGVVKISKIGTGDKVVSQSVKPGTEIKSDIIVYLTVK